VISNLLDNAIKYTDKGEIKISAEVIENKISVDNRKFLHMVKIEVADTGFGVPALYKIIYLNLLLIYIVVIVTVSITLTV
jgi:K+-sensing histidine kinase KdpD